MTETESIIQDSNRGIGNGNLRYNVLNLVREIVINHVTLQYHYDAAGSKFRMSNSNGAVNTKYAVPFEYDLNNYLTRIATEEGQISITGNGNEYAFEYYLKDHLGNVRMVMNEAGAKVQETEYFAFGLAIPKMVGTNKYLYNGKEKQPDTECLDFGIRMYMPEIGRMSTVDKSSNLFHNMSPYSYGLDNPLLNIDPSGDTTYAVTDLNENWDNFGPNSDDVNLNEVTIVRPGTRNNLIRCTPMMLLYLAPGSRMPMAFNLMHPQVV